MNDYEAHMQRLMDVTRESNFSFWNALLTVNGIIAGVFAAVAFFESQTKPIAFLIVLLSMISAGLMIENFRCTRNTYRSMGRVDPNAVLQMASDEKERQIGVAVAMHAACGRREVLAYVAMGVQGLAILGLIWWKA